jgi:hypothetical protein
MFLEDVLDRAFQLLGGSLNGGVDRGCMMRCSHWRMTGEPGFHQAALVVGSVLRSVFVADKDLNPSQTVIKPAESSFNFGLNLGNEGLTAREMIVRMDLYEHDGFLAREARPVWIIAVAVPDRHPLAPIDPRPNPSNRS